jgi:archaellum biogenesis ATPase FlaH
MSKEKELEVREYTQEQQLYLLQFLLSSPEAFARCRNILHEEFFHTRLRKVVKELLAYSDEHKVLPTLEHIKAKFGIELAKVEAITDLHIDAFLTEIETFCRHRAMENVIYNGTDLIAKGHYADVERRIKEAMLISLQRDMGTNYFEDPRARLLRLKENNGMVSTGWKAIDQKLYGGLNRREITLFCGSSGAGKSLFLQNIALNWIAAGLNVVYVTCELSEDLVAMRLDAMLTSVATREIFSKLDQVELAIKMQAKKAGRLQVKYLPPGTTANDLRAYLREYMIQSSIRPDALVIDYLDLLYPNNKRIDPSNLFVKDKFVTEELRALVAEMNMLGVSAAQLNRSAVQEQEHDQSMIAGGLSKIQTADNVLTIHTSEPMRERGEYRLQFIKTRSSSGVGSKILLAFNPATLRITDTEDAGSARAKDVSDITAELTEKRKSQRTAENNAPESTISDAPEKDTNSVSDRASSIRNLLARLNN